ncbi:Uncharacterised protein [Yersinia mollaretii]|nr:Uncharacterised protein [Yersinia mollaretii]CQH01166.1 Uncharacterised protein [Yersinia mollaretii]
MELLRPIIITIALSTVSCATPSKHEETKECMQYRVMMTAPMPQAAVDDLRKKCEESR